MDFKLPQRIENSNKRTYGKVLNIAGSDYMTGAAYLSSVSALKIGCGYCFLCSTERAINAVSAQSQNIVFIPIGKIASAIADSDVIEIGCGLSTNDTAVNLFSKVIDCAYTSTPIVIDADAINILAENNIDLQYDFINKNFENTVFTPHPKEASRLLNCSLEEVLTNIERSAQEITKKYNCVTVLKTHKTFICSPDGRIYTNTTGNNSMAKAGSGDVLTGMISGLIAQGMDIFEASCLGVYLHGICADLAKEKLTEYSVMADDLISFIPFAIKNYQN